MKRIRIIAVSTLLLISAITASAVEYGIYIGETMITSDNANDVLGNGQFIYNASSKALFVNSARLTNSGTLGSGIRNLEVDGLKIKFNGLSTFTTRNSCIISNKSFSIIGEGILNATSTDGYGIEFSSKNENETLTCRIDGPTLSFDADRCGVYSYYGNGKLIVAGTSTSLTLQPHYGNPAIFKVRDLTLEDKMGITEPLGGYYSTELNSITTDGNTRYKGKVMISSPVYYGLEIDGHNVTSTNYEEMGYDPQTRTLTLENRELYGWGSLLSEGEGIVNTGVENLNIHLIGFNSNFANGIGIISYKDFTFTGDGTFQINQIMGASIDLRYDATCTIDGPTIYADDGVFGNLNGTEKTGTLVVKGNSWFKGELGCLRALILLDGQTILKPEGGYFSKELGYVTVDGTPYYGSVLISHEQSEIPSDVNGDGVTDVADIATVIDIMAGNVDPDDPLKGDVNGDGIVDVADIATIISIMAGK